MRKGGFQMNIIYLVIVHSGSYEDKASEPRKAFFSKEKADAFVISETAHIDKHIGILINNIHPAMKVWDDAHPYDWSNRTECITLDKEREALYDRLVKEFGD